VFLRELSQPEERQDRQNDNDGSDNPDNTVHWCSPRSNRKLQRPYTSGCSSLGLYILSREHREGAELREIINEVLEPYLRQNTTRFDIKGPKLRLTPRMAPALAMALHELATNAAKHGALSVSSGWVVITWSMTPNDPMLLTFLWQEQDGPLVSQPARLEHRTFKWTHHQRPWDRSRIAEMQNSSDPTSHPML
jgi:hypothetical protein